MIKLVKSNNGVAFVERNSTIEFDAVNVQVDLTLEMLRLDLGVYFEIPIVDRRSTFVVSGFDSENPDSYVVEFWHDFFSDFDERGGNVVLFETNDLRQLRSFLMGVASHETGTLKPPLIKDADPELEKLIAEEEEIERQTEARNKKEG